MDQRIRELDAVNRLTREVTASLSIEQVISAAYKHVISIIEPDLMVIYLRVGDKLICQGKKVQHAQLITETDEVKTVGECLCGKVAAEKAPIYASDIHSDPRCMLKECKQAGICSFAALPLTTADEIIGVLGLGAFNNRDFSQQATFLETIANRISIGLRNAILHKKIQQEKLRLEKLLADQAELLQRQRKAEEALRKSEEKYRELFENGCDLLCVHDLEGNLIQTNLSFKKTYGWSEEELINMNLRDLVPQAYRHEVDDYLKRIIENGKDEGFLMVLTKNGREIVIEYVNVLVCNKTGPIRVQGSGRDITERLRYEQALKKSEEKYKAILDNIEDGYYEVDLAGNFTFFNNSMCRMLGYEPSELVGMNNQTFMDKKNAAKVFQTFNRVFATGKPAKEFDWELIKKDNSRCYVDTSVSLIRDAGGKGVGFRGITRNIMERKLAEKALIESEKRYRELSIIDDLTRLYNSRHFYNQLKIEIDRVNRHKYPVTIILLDVDDFKDFNDAYGHVEGDRVLTRLGRVIKRCLRKTDSAYRYGGEEFIVLMPMTKSGDGIIVAERIRTEFKKENFSPMPGEKVQVTLSLGVCHYKLQENMKAFVNRVDQLMYQAKKKGKDRVCHEL